MLPVASPNFQWRMQVGWTIGNWQHWHWQQFHIGNIKQDYNCCYPPLVRHERYGQEWECLSFWVFEFFQSPVPNVASVRMVPIANSNFQLEETEGWEDWEMENGNRETATNSQSPISVSGLQLCPLTFELAPLGIGNIGNWQQFHIGNIRQFRFAIDSSSADVVDSFCFRELKPRLAGP